MRSLALLLLGLTSLWGVQQAVQVSEARLGASLSQTSLETLQRATSRQTGPILKGLRVDVGRLPHGDHPSAMKVYRLVSRAVKSEELEWDLSERLAMVELAWEESRLNPRDVHPDSGARGLFQFLPTTWRNTGIEPTDDPLQQTVAAARYIEARYTCPCRALEFQQTPRMLNGKMQRYY